MQGNILIIMLLRTNAVTNQKSGKYVYSNESDRIELKGTKEEDIERKDEQYE